MRRFRCDPWLAASLLTAALFCAYGIHWGRAECWNNDEIALRPLNGLHPGYFYKPPFHIYLNHLLVSYPMHLAERIAKQLYLHTPVRFNEARLIGSRLLTAGLFLGTIAFLFAISLAFYGRFAARVIALLAATSAGFIAFAHFLTPDSPLLFWMAGAAYFSGRIVHSGKTRDYILAGVFAGLAAATKYNGVLVAIAIPVAHLFSPNCREWRSLFDWRMLLSAALVPISFVAGNPYAVLDHKKFVADFMYTYSVTPGYGQQGGPGYGKFLLTLPEILGLPGTIVVAFCIAASLVLLIRRRDDTRNARIGFCIAASVALIYYLSLGSFIRVPARFVLPAVPFIILMTGPFLAVLETRGRMVVQLLIIPVIGYNAICCLFVGKRFSDDPRLAAQDWMIAHARGKTIQSSYMSPHWTKLYRLRGVEFQADRPPAEPAPPNSTVDWRLPATTGRKELFRKVFAGNHWIEEGISIEGDPDQTLFSVAGQAARNPDLISIYSADVEVPVESVSAYYNDLLAEKSGYKTLFHGTTPEVSPLVYPKIIDCLAGTITILSR